MCFFKKRKNNNEMTNKQAINLLFHIGNNINKFTEDAEEAEIYIQAIEKAVNALKEKTK